MKSYVLAKNGFVMRAYLITTETNCNILVIASSFDNAISVYRNKYKIDPLSITEFRVKEINIEEDYENI